MHSRPDEIAYALLASLVHFRFPAQPAGFGKVLGWRCIGILGVGTGIPKKWEGNGLHLRGLRALVKRRQSGEKSLTLQVARRRVDGGCRAAGHDL